MTEYIEREALLSKLTFENGRRIPEVDVDNFPTTVAIRDVKKLIRELPAADVAPVVHGERLKVETDYLTRDLLKRCSVCGYVGVKPHGNYCQSCGAKMQEAR